MPVSRTETAHAALTTFARQIKADVDLRTRINANPEDQLKTTVGRLVKEIGAALKLDVSILSETPVEDIGRAGPRRRRRRPAGRLHRAESSR